MFKVIFVFMMFFYVFDLKATNWELTKERGINYYNIDNLKIISDNNDDSIKIHLFVIDSDKHLTDVSKVISDIGLYNKFQQIEINTVKPDSEYLIFVINDTIKDLPEKDIKIINLSWGFEKINFPENLINNKNTFYIVAAGNSNLKDYNDLCKNEKNFICVGGTDFDNEKSNFSNWGDRINILAHSGSSYNYVIKYEILNKIVEKVKWLFQGTGDFNFYHENGEIKLKRFVLPILLSEVEVDFNSELYDPEIENLINIAYNNLRINNISEGVVSIKDKFNFIFNIYENKEKDKYNLDSNGVSGTSYAAPLVAGSLYYAFYENLKENRLTNEQVVESLKYTGVFIPTFSGIQVCNYSENIINSREMCNSYTSSNPRKVDLEAAINAIRIKETVEIESQYHESLSYLNQWKIIKGYNIGGFNS